MLTLHKCNETPHKCHMQVYEYGLAPTERRMQMILEFNSSVEGRKIVPHLTAL